MVSAAPVSPPAISSTTRWLAILGMALCMLIYGSNFVISRHAMLNGLTPHDMLALRFGLAGLLLLPVFLRAGVRDCAGIGWKRGILLAIMSGVPMNYVMMTGLSLAPSAHAATIAPGTVTVISVIGSVILFGAIVTRQMMVGLAILASGLAVLAIAASTGASRGVLVGDLCFLAVGLLWGAYPLLIQKWWLDPLNVAAAATVLSLAYLPYYALFQFRGFDVAPLEVIAFHGFNQAVLNVVVGLWIWGWAARTVGNSVVGRFPPAIPVIGTLLAIPVLGEWPGLAQWLGITLIVGGLAFTAWRPVRNDIPVA